MDLIWMHVKDPLGWNVGTPLRHRYVHWFIIWQRISFLLSARLATGSPIRRTGSTASYRREGHRDVVIQIL